MGFYECCLQYHIPFIFYLYMYMNIQTSLYVHTYVCSEALDLKEELNICNDEIESKRKVRTYVLYIQRTVGSTCD